MKRRAVIVGVDGNAQWDFKPLEFAVADAIRMHTLLHLFQDRAPFERIELLRDPSDEQVRRAVRDALRGLAAGDLFTFYFSGHGKRQTTGKYLLLCPQAERTVIEAEDTNGTVTDAWLKRTTSDGAYDCLFIFDCCRSELVPERDATRGERAPAVMDGEDRLRNLGARQVGAIGGTRAAAYSCPDGACAREIQQLKAGLFTYALDQRLREQLRSEGPVRIDSDLIVEQVGRLMRELAPDYRDQRPGFYCEAGAGITLAEGREDMTGTPAEVRRASGKVIVIAPPRLHITTKPSGAQVWVDGKAAGRAPVAVDLAAGQHTVRVEQTGYAVWERRIAFDAKGDAGLEVALVALPKGPKAGDSDVADLGGGVTLELVWIPPGTFMMGGDQSPEEVARLCGGVDGKPDWFRDEQPQHQVTLTQGFWMGKYEVTQGQWERVMGNNPSYFKGDPRLPVEDVSWEDCQEFIDKLNSRVSGGGFRLPTEAQWEYACRAGTTTPFHFGQTISTEQANYDGNYTYANGGKGIYRQKTTPVGSFPANAWGLHDMHGNVWEWCSDWYGDYPSGAVTDPAGPSSGTYRVLRGGSWINNPTDCRSPHRAIPSPVLRSGRSGFRVVRTP